MFTPWKRLNRKTVFNNGYGLIVQQDTVQLPNGSIIDYTVLDKCAYLVVVPCDAHGNVLLIEQYRYPLEGHGPVMTDLIAGGIQVGEDPLQIAAQELREEGGAIAMQIEQVGVGFTSPGITNEKVYIYFASGITLSTQALEPSEQIRPFWVPGKIAIAMAEAGEMHHISSAYAILRCRSRIEALCT